MQSALEPAPPVPSAKGNILYDVEFSRRLCIIKSSRVTSRVMWLNGEETNVSRTISVLFLRAHLVTMFPCNMRRSNVAQNDGGIKFPLSSIYKYFLF
jgi:hypothetical protein